jgi:hypothetical protein
MAACICEYEARRYAKLDRSHLAGAFKRTARMAAAATRRWLNERPFRHIKNGFPPETTHGIDGGHYSVYALLAANLFGVAYHMADETIPEAPAPVEVGGTAIELPGDFHKVFATCGGYHLEIDTRADLNYDATGLGRVHRTGVPSELGPSAPITSRPRYKVSVPPFSRPVAIGPAWQGRDGTWHALAGCSEEIRQVAVEVHFETEREVGFQVAYRGDLPGGVEVVERYRITSEGVEIEDEVRGDVRAIRVHLPLLATDGLRRSEIVSGEGRFEVRYAGSRYEASSSDEGVASGIEEGEAPNRNGIYRIGWLERKGERIRCRIRLA